MLSFPRSYRHEKANDWRCEAAQARQDAAHEEAQDEVTSRTSKLLGPPGTGKTTYGLREVHTHLKSGTSPARIAYTAFTRKAAHEAVERAITQFSFTREDFPHFGTLHSLAFRLLELTPDRVMTKKHFQDLGERLGPYAFQGSYDENSERGHPDGELGDVCLHIHQLHRAMMVSLEEAWRLVQDHPTRYGPPRTGPLPFHVVEYFSRGLEEYKRQHDLLDFTDFLDKCTSVLDVDLFILDEAQDLTPQQWRFARQLGRTAKKVLVAADDDQALYPWAGADVELLLRLNGENLVLPVSHRLPRAVFNYLQGVASHIQRRLPKHFSPRDGEGTVRILNNESEVSLLTGEWMLLARTNWLTGRLVTTARRAGVVYEHGGMWSNQDPTVLAVIAYEKLRRGETVIPAMAKLVARYGKAHIAAPQPHYSWEDFIWPFDGKPYWMDALVDLGAEQREYIRSCLKNKESLTQPGRVRISTIHQAKGGECDNVLVLGDMGRRVENSFWADMDAELRVWYVALSRAKENLFLVQSQRPSPLQAILAPR